jgi:glycolate oxidase FAD binding subunit
VSSPQSELHGEEPVMYRPRSIEELQAALRELPWVCVRGGGSKPALSAVANVELSGLAGLVDYEPQEFTFTAYAGTPLASLQDILSRHGQFLPFDPVRVETGATLGGAIASGLSGPGRFRYGGIRDFVLGVLLVTGGGERVYGGGRVVKNAAGFDLPKLMVGSLGRLAVIVEVTCKVFPAPAKMVTLQVDYPTLDQALNDYLRLARLPLDLTCLDFEPPARLWIRFGGLAEAVPARLKRCLDAVTGSAHVWHDDHALWRSVTEFQFVPPDCGLARVAITPSQIPRWEEWCRGSGFDHRRYSVGGHVLWLAVPQPHGWAALHTFLMQQGVSAVAALGSPFQPVLGKLPGGVFAERLRSVFDPQGKFPPLQKMQLQEDRSNGVGVPHVLHPASDAISD